MSFRHLPSDRIDDLFKAAQQLDLAAPDNRRALFQGIDPSFRLSIAGIASPNGQLVVDLAKLNETERLLDGTVPMEQWLSNATKLGGLDERAVVFQEALDDLTVRTSGQPTWTAPSDLPEYKEAVIHQDDRVPFDFLEQGRMVGASVARVQVPRHDGGKPAMLGANPVVYNGTGWLIGHRLLITNHHVVNARDVDPPAAPDDFGLQAENASVQFGFDAAARQGTTVAVAGLAAEDAALDFAILELAADPPAPPLRLATDPLVLNAGEYPPLNIIQHPLGGPKMIAIRNNLATRSTDTDLRYFTDTDYGSSGSPVFDDTWTVVALHRAASAAKQPVSFQGRSTAVVNVGTRITTIVEYLKAHHPELWQRIGA
jgi:endonuclease G, mitochondrial